jgi:hypothetical protein
MGQEHRGKDHAVGDCIASGVDNRDRNRLVAAQVRAAASRASAAPSWAARLTSSRVPDADATRSELAPTRVSDIGSPRLRGGQRSATMA